MLEIDIIPTTNKVILDFCGYDCLSESIYYLFCRQGAENPPHNSSFIDPVLVYGLIAQICTTYAATFQPKETNTLPSFKCFPCYALLARMIQVNLIV